MKKRTINAFTLVEMLIVIVIIGILIAALLPRMQAAQGRARDVSRKTALSQIQSAIVTRQGDHGKWPSSGDTLDENGKNEGIGIDTIKAKLIDAGMSDVPLDPLNDSKVTGLGGATAASGNYLYMVSVRNGSPNAGFVLMAKTEVAGGSNWVVCSGTTSTEATVLNGNIGKGMDLAKVSPCSSIKKGKDSEVCTNSGSGGECIYKTEDQLRYIVLY